ncbi:hypothetical protein ASC94_00045 [Massilia sp. Root418]|uniref:response regulator n=1 Tax=Massilia sp. Root418 TaxID=1736532 RepID=UPI0006F99C80|nr:response regulator [Massilia sp. Root418]KQX01087.1 hypothetical protein ASC94_00045 [Massilia sp. Root418]
MNHTGSRRILVVDDSQDVINLLVEMFTSWGHEVGTVCCGADAVSAVVRLAPDIVFLDISMPDMNGFEVAARVRSLEGRSPRLVAFTSFMDAAFMQKARATGFDLHVPKTADLPRLLAALEIAPAAHGEGSRR